MGNRRTRRLGGKDPPGNDIEKELMGITEIAAARQQLDNAKKMIKDQAEKSIKEELVKIFSDVDVDAVQWSQKSSEYNDEGMYPGIHGPYFVTVTNGDEHINRELYGYGQTPVPPELESLKRILDCIGDDILSEIFGDENVNTVTRSGKGVIITSDYADY